MTKDAAVTVGTEDCVVSFEVWDGTHELVSHVVLEWQVYQAFVVKELVEVAKDSLHQQESIEVFMTPSRSIIEDAQTLLLIHLIIAYIQESWIENWRVHIEDWDATICSLELAKMLLGQVNKLLMLYGACSDNHHVFSEVHSLMILDNHLPVDPADVFNFAEDWQAHHVIPVDVEVHVLHECFEVIIVCCVQFLEDCVLLHFHVVVIVLRIAQHVSQDVH